MTFPTAHIDWGEKPSHTCISETVRDRTKNYYFSLMERGMTISDELKIIDLA